MKKTYCSHCGERFEGLAVGTVCPKCQDGWLVLEK